MRIGIDFDGVVSDSGKLKCAAALEMYGIIIPEEKFKWEILIGEGILSEEQYRVLQKKIYEDPAIGLQATPVAGALEYIQKLIDDGHEVTVITSRNGQSLLVAQQWAQRHGLNIPFVGVGYPNSKKEAAITTGIKVFIDDDLEKLEELHQTVPHLFLFSWPYNTHIDETTVSQRIHSWEKFYDTISLLSND